MNKLLVESARLAAGVMAIVAALVWLSGGCGERIEPGELPDERDRAEGETAAVESVTGPVSEVVSGTLISARQTTISSKILARIESVAVSAGSVVARGDELVRLDSRDLDARVREAREGVSAARTQLELAQREAKRVKGMIAGGAASAQQLDRVESQERVARADLEAAEQRLADAEVGLSFAAILSPVSGRVVDRLAEPGDIAAPGAPLLQIYDPGALRLEVPVRETLAVRLAPGQSLRVEIAAIDEIFQGRIDEIVPFADPGARTLMVKVRLPADPRLFAGMFGRVEVPAGERARLLIPDSAVSRVGQLQFVTAVDAEGRAGRRLVTTGNERDGRVEVLSGLAAGERVLNRAGP